MKLSLLKLRLCLTTIAILLCSGLAVAETTTPEDTKKPYVRITTEDNNRILTFYYGTPTDDALELAEKYTSASNRPWNNNFQKVVFDTSFADYLPTSTSYWFYNFFFLIAIDGIENLNTSNVTDMSYMFYSCMSLPNIDLSHFNTSNVNNMNYMLYRCVSLTSLDVSVLNTSKVTKMEGLFSTCSALASLDLSNFDTSNVRYMGHLFSACSSLSSLDLSHFNTGNAAVLGSLFNGCTSLTNLDLSNFDTSKAHDFNAMFYGCSALTNVNLSSFNTENALFTNNMFYGCSALTSINISNFNTNKVTNMGGMFSECSSLQTIYVGEGWSTDAVTDGTNIFWGSSNLVGGQGTLFDANNISVSYAHIDGGIENPGYFTAAGTFEGLLGDANCDGAVDVVDVTTVVDFILGKAQPTAEQFVNADVNRDQSVDVVDLTCIVSIILGTYNPDATAAGVKALMPSSDILALDGKTVLVK